MNRNQWQSLICMLYTTTPTLKYTQHKINTISTFTFTDYKLKVMYNQSLFLVDVVRENTDKILKLNSIQGGRKWIGIDMLIFNIWYWWYRRGVTQPWDYIQLGNPVVNDMNRLYAMEQALIAWGRWVDTNVVSNKTLVFFQGVSPIPYIGSEWKEPKANSCKGQMKPVSGSTYPRQLPPAMAVMKEVLRGIRMPVTLLDVTLLLQLRKDGHPSIYGGSGPRVMDCTLWWSP
ncbi:protein trichome birefringence-like 41 [Camellia sinensis]|uniref:protein trichome birefringence-like 41 n=1 Tax=Camellia sinensis TaxID=4442 RepID=UPI0010368680|nr:protein trichome birefringence-like 41 [Camellia sinensis]